MIIHHPGPPLHNTDTIYLLPFIMLYIAQGRGEKAASTPPSLPSARLSSASLPLSYFLGDTPGVFLDTASEEGKQVAASEMEQRSSCCCHTREIQQPMTNIQTAT